MPRPPMKGGNRFSKPGRPGAGRKSATDNSNKSAFNRKPRSFDDQRSASFGSRPEGGESRPPFRREGGGESRPPFRREGGSDSRPPFRREGGGDSRPPFRREGGDSRPPFRREGGGESRPPFRREGGGDSRPPFRREGGGDSRPPFRREGGGDSRPPFRREGGSDSRPPFRREGGSDSRPPFRREGGGDSRPPFRREGGGDSRPPQRREGGSYGDRPQRREGGSYGDRPQRREGGSYGDRPQRREGGSYGDRPQRRDDSRPPRREFEDNRPPRRESAFEDKPQTRGPGNGFGENFPPRREYDNYEARPPRREGSDSRPPRRDGDDSRPPRRDGDDSRPPRRDEGAYDARPPRRDEGAYDARPPRRDEGAYEARPPRRDEGAYDALPPRRDEGAYDARPPRRDSSESRPPRREGDDFEPRAPRREGEDTRPAYRENKPEPKRVLRPRKSKTDDSEDGDEATEGMRLNKFLSHAGLFARRKATEVVMAGEITVNGKVMNQAGFRVRETDLVMYKGAKVAITEKKVYYIMNKPKDVITTNDDEKGRKTVLDILSTKVSQRVYPVGRLDRNTTGLLLITNDGELAQHLSHPSTKVPKVYHVILDRPVKAEHIREIETGITLEDGLIQVDGVSYVNNKAPNEVGVEIHSGRNRIVRRIFEHFGYEVVKLDRVYYAGLTKKDLTRGHFRELKPAEVIMLKHFVK